MLTKYLKVLIAVGNYLFLTNGQKATLPYQFCKLNISVEVQYNITSTICDSVCKDAEQVRQLIWNSTSVQNKCSHNMLIITPDRIIKHTGKEQIKVNYTFTISLQENHLYNYSILNDNLCSIPRSCHSTMDQEIFSILDNTTFKNFLALNISGNPLNFSSFAQLDRGSPCDCKPKCPSRSRETNRTCVCSPGSFLDNTTTKCVPCPIDKYQEELGKLECKACPSGHTTYNKTGSLKCLPECPSGSSLDINTTKCVPCPIDKYKKDPRKFDCNPCPRGNTTYNKTGSSKCFRECDPGLFYNFTTSNCDPCPLNFYRNLKEQLNCTRCPSGKITINISSSREEDCSENPDCKVDVLAIALPIAVIAVLVILAIPATKIFIDRRKRRRNEEMFRKNFQVYENKYFQEAPGDEEQEIEHSATLGPLEPEVHARNLEVPRDCIKLTGVRLGRGNFGEVHQVLVKRNNEPEMLCAAKTTRGARRLALSDMLEELEIHLKIEKNPNVVNLLGVCSSSDGPFYLLVEFCDNGCLKDFLKDHRSIPKYVNTEGRRPLDLQWKLHRILEICNGMKFLSSQKIVHRDLAARNILLDQNMVAKVSDFGMAKDVYVKSYYKQRHEGNFPLRWMAIESIQELTFNEKTDVWSFGVLTWEIFTDGKFPYYNIINDEKVAHYILTGKKLKRPSQCPKYLYRIISKCWHEKDYDRPRFRELHDELGVCMTNERNQEPPKNTKGSIKKRFSDTKRSMSKKLSRNRSFRNIQTSSPNGSCSVTPQIRRRSGRKESLLSNDIARSCVLENLSEASREARAPSRKDTGESQAAVSNGEVDKEISTDNNEKGNYNKSDSDDIQGNNIQLEADFHWPRETNHLNKSRKNEIEITSSENPEADKDIDS